MNEGKISVRYAQALYALAEEKGLQHEVYASMVRLSEAFTVVEGLSDSLSNPMYEPAAKLELLLTASGAGTDSLVANFFRFVLEKGREAYMVFVVWSFQTIYREKERIVTGKITSALPLSESAIDRIRQLIRDRYEASLELVTNVDPDIIGGFILEVDNNRMDSSIRTRLEQIRNGLLQE